MLINSFVNSIL